MKYKIFLMGWSLRACFFYYLYLLGGRTVNNECVKRFGSKIFHCDEILHIWACIKILGFDVECGIRGSITAKKRGSLIRNWIQ